MKKNDNSIIADILRDLKRQKKHRSFPDHIAAQAGVVTIEAGRLAAEADKFKYAYGNAVGDIEVVRNAAIRTAAAAIRFIENIDSNKLYHGTENSIQRTNRARRVPIKLDAEESPAIAISGPIVALSSSEEVVMSGEDSGVA